MIKNFVSNFKPSNTVDSAIASFHAIVDNLNDIAAKHTQKAADAAEAKAEAHAAQMLAEAEATRAKVVAGKIQALVGSY
jgi:hypothetical protein